MSLPDPAPRECLQNRTITCKGYRREDGLWDIEGHLLDTRTYSYLSRERGMWPPGAPIHEMWMRLTLDDSYEVKTVATSMDAFPMAVCPGIVRAYQGLVGLRIGRGWNQSVRALVGGAKGCTHLLELLGPIASTAVQTIAGFKDTQKKAGGDEEESAPKIVSCHALAR